MRTRLAPSPTGALHVGNARTFLLTWLHVRAAGGSVVLRIDDLDGPRVKAGREKDAIASQVGNNWYLDAGKKGFEDFVIEIRATLAQQRPA